MADSTLASTSVALTGAATVTANFSINVHTLTVNATNGTVAKNPDQSSYIHGTSVQLTATPLTGYIFTGWSGNISGSTNPITISTDSNMTITATFAINTYSLSVNAGTGGSISTPASSPATVNHGAITAITAVPQTGYTFAKWTRSSANATMADSTLASTSVALTGAATVTAIFTLNAPSVPVSVLPATNSSTAIDSMLLVWNKAIPTIDKYGIRIATDSGMTVTIAIDTTHNDTTYLQTALIQGQTYYWQVRAHNATGWGNYGEKRKFTRTITTAVLPKTYAVAFNGIRSNGGSMNFALPQASPVTMRLFNMQGKIVKVLFSDILAAGYHTARLDMSSVAKGSYVLEFMADKYNVKKVVYLIK
jgi:uncharacterized repeat protein (TIGR02543 family)